MSTQETDYSAAAVTEHTKRMAIEAFQRHQLILDDRVNGRWRIARKYDDGTFDGHYASEIISLWGGRLYVGGDISDCTFAYYSGGQKQDSPEWHLAKLRWMGKNDDLGYYVAQKAAIGMTDGNRLVKEWDSKVAAHQLREYLKENDWSQRSRDALAHALIRVQGDESPERVYEALSRMDDGGMDLMGSLGMVTAPRVIYAWAAMRRLCELIDEKDRADGNP